MRIFICGASGVGKTTLINEIKKLDQFKDYLYVESARQKILDLNLSHSDNSNEETQRVYFNHYLEHLVNDNLICDRSLFDVLAYSKLLLISKKVDYNLIREQSNGILENIKHTDKYFFIPPEFDLIDDGFRKVDKEYQYNVSYFIRGLLDQYLHEYGMKYYVLTGNVDARLEKFIIKVNKEVI